MKAIRRNKSMYEFMMTFENNFEKTNLLVKEVKKAKENLSTAFTTKDFTDKNKAMQRGLTKYELLLRLLNLKYMEILPLTDTLMITHEGWKFCESYERYIERKYTNIILAILTGIMAAYSIFEVWKYFYTCSY